MPRLLAVDQSRERLLKEYIDGLTIAQLVEQEKVERAYFVQVEEMCRKLYSAGLNIDYYPTNFVVQGGMLYYIDYECNQYDPKWDFENWGRQYWQK
jgi:tRNA A-37 threonylcarbamoyl transferase component Bud32